MTKQLVTLSVNDISYLRSLVDGSSKPNFWSDEARLEMREKLDMLYSKAMCSGAYNVTA